MKKRSRQIPTAPSGALVVLRTDPFNCETAISALDEGTVTPNSNFYVRNHFAVPAVDVKRWRLEVGGLVRRPLRLSMQELVDLPSRVMPVTLECAGNGRASLAPAVPGEQWALGAVSTALWTGVPLAEVLERAGVESAAREVVFRGAEGRSPKGRSGAGRFERSLTLAEVRECQVLLAYAMNGETLPAHHGYPLRAIVPGWYGVASVKWLTDIEVIDSSFSGYFQTEKYIYEWERDGHALTEPVRQQRVRALITHPATDQVVQRGPLVVRGLAWSGVAPIARVEVSINREAWQPARLLGQRSRYSWRRWELVTHIDVPGRASIRARATDSAGRTQPEQPEWNRLGYGNNAVQELPILAV